VYARGGAGESHGGEPLNHENLTQTQLLRLLDLGRSLVSELELETVLRHVLEAAAELTGARYAALGILDEHKRELERFLFTGIDEATRERIGPLPRGRGVLGELIRDPKPLRLKDVKEHPRSYGFPAGHPPMTTFAGVPILIRGEAYGNLYLADKRDGAEFDERDEKLLVVLARWAAIAIDNARLYEGAERRRAELERAVQGLEATVSLNREVGGETDIERVLELVVKRGRALVDARTFLCLLPRDGALAVAEAAGDGAAEIRGRALPAEDPLAGEAFSSGDSRRFGDDEVDLSDLGIPASAGIVAPLRFRGRSAGVLVALSPLERDQFSADDELLLNSFATSAATAIVSAQSVESEKLRLAMEASEQERQRWARELHDETLQELGALTLMHESALQRGEPELMRRSLQRANAQLEQTIAGLERLISELRPAALDQLGVQAALEALVERTREAQKLKVETEIALAWERGEARTRLAPELEATVYRLVQEALNNVIKHADAAHVRIAVIENTDTLTVAVEDDGRGFDAATAGGRFGLVGMRERAALGGGELRVDSEPGRGTRVSATMPVVRADRG
jgi:signal transduction histidine kinase